MKFEYKIEIILLENRDENVLKTETQKPFFFTF
jgi:hypothetical protein